MSSAETSREKLLNELFTQGDWERSQAFLTKHLRELDEDFLHAILTIADREREEGRLWEAFTVYGHGRVAATLIGDPLFEVDFLTSQSELLHELGHDQAEEAAGEAFIMTDELLEEERRVLPAFVGASLRLSDLLADRGEYGEARRVLAHARRRSRQFGSLAGELWATQSLLDLCVRANELRAARGYAGRLARGLTETEVDAREKFEPPERSNAYALLLDVTNALHHVTEDFEGAAAVAEHAIALVPDDARAYVALANALSELQRWEAAASAWEAAIAHPPVLPSSLYNYALTLAFLDRLDAALHFLNEAVIASPGKARYYLSRGQIQQRLGHHEQAIADFTVAVDLGRAKPMEEEDEQSARSVTEWLRTISPRDVADFANLYRIQSYSALAREHEALTDIEVLLREGDDTGRVWAFVERGRLAEAAGRHAEAVEAFSAALAVSPADVEAHLGRADAYLAQRLFDEAIPDLAFVAHRERDPNAVVDRLNQVLEGDLDHPLLLKWRGYAYYQALRPSKAVDDLTRAIETFPADSDAHLWRGLARITTAMLPEEREWDDTFSLERLYASLEDHATAVALASDDEALSAYRWLVDVASGEKAVLDWLVASGDESNGLFSLTPAAREPIRHAKRGFSLSTSRAWDEAVAELLRAQAGFVAASLPIWAKRMDLFLADNLVRLNEFQLALDHLSEAEKVFSMLSHPFTPADLTARAKENIETAWEATGTEGIAVELEYASVCGIGLTDFEGVRLLEAEILDRLGEPQRAVYALGDIEEYFELKEPGSGEEPRFQTIYSVARILRDAGDYKRAITLADRLRTLATEPRQLASAYNLWGTVLELAGRWGDAVASFRKARAESATAGLPALGVTINIANASFRAGRLEEALNALSEIDAHNELRNLRDRGLYYTLQAHILHALGRDADAMNAVERALGFAEQERSSVRPFDFRMSLHGRYENIHELAVEIAVRKGDARVAFDFAESSRSRAFVDQLATGRIPLPPEGQRFERVERNLIAKRDLLRELTSSVADFGADFVDYDAVKRLQDVDEAVDVLDGGADDPSRLSLAKIAEALAESENHLRSVQHVLENMRQSQTPGVSGEVLRLSDARTLLSSSSGG